MEPETPTQTSHQFDIHQIKDDFVVTWTVIQDIDTGSVVLRDTVNQSSFSSIGMAKGWISCLEVAIRVEGWQNHTQCVESARCYHRLDQKYRVWIKPKA